MSLPDFKLLRPRTLDQALDLLARHAPDVQLIAGGTDLIPSLRQGLFSPRYLLDLRGLAELRGIDPQADGSLVIGALTTLAQLEASALILRRYPVLHQAAAAVASPLLRNMGTLGGNLCLDTRCLWYNQSLAWRQSCGFCIKKGEDVDKDKDRDHGESSSARLPAAPAASALLCHVAPGGARCWAAFSADTPPALLCLDALIEIAGSQGFRLLPLVDFYTGLGEARLRLQPGEVLTRVLLPASAAGWRGVYRKLRVRGSIDYPLAGVAVALRLADSPASGLPSQRSGRARWGESAAVAPAEADAAAAPDSLAIVAAVRVAITGVNPAPLLLPEAAQLLVGHALDDHAAAALGELAARTAKPLTTSALTPEYRREMIRVFTRRALLAAAA